MHKQEACQDPSLPVSAQACRYCALIALLLLALALAPLLLPERRSAGAKRCFCAFCARCFAADVTLHRQEIFTVVSINRPEKTS